MPRTLNKTYYHYKITDKDTGISKYYRTLADIKSEYGLCRTSVYHRIAGNHKPVIYTNLIFERDYIPISEVQQN
jgi:hypothetical protein